MKGQLLFLSLLFCPFTSFSQESKGINLSFKEYNELSYRATVHYYAKSYDSCAVYFNKAFDKAKPRLFDQFYCAQCYALKGAGEKAKPLLKSIVKMGYPVNTLLSNNSFSHGVLSDPSFVDNLVTIEKSALGPEYLKLSEELKKRVEQDKNTRSSCPTRDCKAWKAVTQDNIKFLEGYVNNHGFPCGQDLGYAMVYINLILLHGKSEPAYDFFNPILFNEVLAGCFNPAYYAYWVDGYHTSILNAEEVYGTVSLAKYRYGSDNSPTNINTVAFERNRAAIGLISFNRAVNLGRSIYK